MIVPALVFVAALARAQSATNAAGSVGRSTDGVRGSGTSAHYGAVVRSKEWIVRRGKRREEEFIGDVRYEAAGTRLTADWALYRQTQNDWQARGHIKGRKELSNGDVVETQGEAAHYGQTTQEGDLEPPKGGRIPLLRTPPGQEPDHAEGDRLSWVGERVGVLSGKTRGWGPQGEFWADNARYERFADGESLTLTGDRPVLHNFQGAADAALKADRIVAFQAPRQATAAGRAIGWVLSESSETEKSSDPNRCGTPAKPGPGPDAKVSALLAPVAAAESGAQEKMFWDAEAAAYADRACPWSARMSFWADAARYEEAPERRLTLDGGRPVVRKLDAEWSTALKADHIVALGPTRTLAATGRVKGWLVFREDEKDKKSKKPAKPKEPKK